MAKKKAQRSQTSGPPSSLPELGKKLVRLGEALQDGSTLVTDLVDLALYCGLALCFTFSKKPQPNDDGSQAKRSGNASKGKK